MPRVICEFHDAVTGIKNNGRLCQKSLMAKTKSSRMHRLSEKEMPMDTGSTEVTLKYRFDMAYAVQSSDIQV